MMAYPFDDKRIILALQIDHSRVAGYFAAHWGNRDFDRPSLTLRLSWPPESTTSVGRNGRCVLRRSTTGDIRSIITTAV